MGFTYLSLYLTPSTSKLFRYANKPHLLLLYLILSLIVGKKLIPCSPYPAPYGNDLICHSPFQLSNSVLWARSGVCKKCLQMLTPRACTDLPASQIITILAFAPHLGEIFRAVEGLLWNLADTLIEVELSLMASTWLQSVLLCPWDLFRSSWTDSSSVFTHSSVLSSAGFSDFPHPVRVPYSLPIPAGAPLWSRCEETPRPILQTPHLRTEEMFYQEGLSESLVFPSNGRYFSQSLGKQVYWSSFIWEHKTPDLCLSGWQSLESAGVCVSSCHTALETTGAREGWAKNCPSCSLLSIPHFSSNLGQIRKHLHFWGKSLRLCSWPHWDFGTELRLPLGIHAKGNQSRSTNCLHILRFYLLLFYGCL